MKNALYILLLILEALVGLIALGLVYSWTGLFICIIVVAAMIVLLVFMVKSLERKREQGDEAGMKKTRQMIALVMLIPVMLALIMISYIVIGMLLYFG